MDINMCRDKYIADAVDKARWYCAQGYDAQGRTILNHAAYVKKTRANAAERYDSKNT